MPTQYSLRDVAAGFQNLMYYMWTWVWDLADRTLMNSEPSQTTTSDHVSTNGSGSQKRAATARMHAVSPRKKPRRMDDNKSSDVKANTGECPPYNDHASWIEDVYNNMVYVFGGTRPGDEDCIPTSDFYRCDTKSMKWEDITVPFHMWIIFWDLIFYVLG